MYAATLRSDPVPSSPEEASAAQPASLARARGRIELSFRRAGSGDTVLEHLYQSGCGRVLLPRVERGAVPEAVLINTAGGLTGGDHLAIRLTCAAQSNALVTTQAAEKIYRSLGADGRVENQIGLEAGAMLAYLPQETILFDRARLRRTTNADLAPGARLLACETLVFGRTARGETMTRGLIHDAWRIRRGGRLVWADTLHAEGDIAELLAQPAGFDGARALASVIYVADDAADRLDPAREILAADGQTARRDLTRFLGHFRARLQCKTTASDAAPLPAPRVWSC